MKLKTLSHWILLTAIACLVGQSLIEPGFRPSKAKIRRPYFHDYPLPSEYSDAHDIYIVGKSIYPIKDTPYKKAKRKHSTHLYPLSTYHAAFYILWNCILLVVLREYQETLDGLSYLLLHFLNFLKFILLVALREFQETLDGLSYLLQQFLDFLKFLNPFKTSFDINSNKNFGICMFLQFAIKRMLITKMFNFAIEPNGLPKSKSVDEIYVDDEISFKKTKQMPNSTQDATLFDFPSLNNYISASSHGESYDGKENGMNDSLANAVPPPPLEFADSFLESRPVSDHGKDLPSKIVQEVDISGSTGVKIDDCGEFMTLI